ncbi:MAG: helix-turn-helix transcriptional regulator [Oscillospiraceae bacterium]|nr:helix-turn-helix transcriptional regulator [Oscillospiraceae bacterium]
MRTHEEVKRELFAKRADVKAEYEGLRPQYELIAQIIAARNEEGLSQEDLAKRTGIARSNISRLESGNYNPSFEFMARVARGLGREIHVEFRKPERELQQG